MWKIDRFFYFLGILCIPVAALFIWFNVIDPGHDVNVSGLWQFGSLKQIKQLQSNLSLIEELSLIEWSIKPKRFCFGNLSSDIAIVSMGDITNGIYDDLLELGRLNKGYYSSQHNYVYCEFPINAEIGRNPTYGKAAALYNTLKLYKYVIWMDFDIVIKNDISRNFDKILSIFANNSSINCVFTSDMGGAPYTIAYNKKNRTIKENGKKQPAESDAPFHYRVNTGIMLFRQTDWTYQFIEEWHSYFKKAEDQQSIGWHYYEHQKEWDKHVKIISYKDIEVLGKSAVNTAQKTKQDTHLLHIAGGKWTWKKKQTIMRNLLLKQINSRLLNDYKLFKTNHSY